MVDIRSPTAGLSGVVKLHAGWKKTTFLPFLYPLNVVLLPQGVLSEPFFEGDAILRLRQIHERAAFVIFLQAQLFYQPHVLAVDGLIHPW